MYTPATDQVVTKLLVTIVGGGLMWPFKILKNKFEEFTAQLTKVQDELITQRTNCLQTIQNQGEIQIKTMERVADTLDQIHVSQAEMSGYLRAKE
jgi:hypothetical protein